MSYVHLPRSECTNRRARPTDPKYVECIGSKRAGNRIERAPGRREVEQADGLRGEIGEMGPLLEYGAALDPLPVGSRTRAVCSLARPAVTHDYRAGQAVQPDRSSRPPAARFDRSTAKDAGRSAGGAGATSCGQGPRMRRSRTRV